MFGLTVFESVLERLREEARQAADAAPEADTGPNDVRGLPAGFTGPGPAGLFVSGTQAAAAYRDFAPDPEDEPPPPPPHLLRIAPEEVAADLDIGENEGIEALLARRRAFARANHPDRAPPELRANATLRMKIANMLIDETVRRMRR